LFVIGIMVLHLLILGAIALKAAAAKTAAAGTVKLATASTHLAVATGAANTVTGATVIGATWTCAALLTIAAVIHKAVNGGYMSEEAARRYEKKIEQLPLIKRQKLAADLINVDAWCVKHVLNDHGIYA
jgi:hypothetical protein